MSQRIYVLLEMPLSNSSEDNNNNYFSVIGVACGAVLFALLVIFGGVSYIVVMMHQRNKVNKKEYASEIHSNISPTGTNRSDHIYETPRFPSATSIINTVIINHCTKLDTGEARVTTVMNSDTQDHHQALHPSNCNTTSIQNTHDSAHLYSSRVTTTTTAATDHSYEAKTTSSPYISHNADKTGETGNYAPNTLPPCDEGHTTMGSSQFADTDKPTGEGKYAPITSPSSDVYPVVDESHTAKVSCSTQAFNGVKPAGGDECATINQQQNFNCDASVNQDHDAAQLSHADNNAGSNAEGI